MKIWRFGHFHNDDEWHVFTSQKRLSFDWLNFETDYSKINMKTIDGRTCIEPWVFELKAGDLIFILNKFNYAGVAKVLDSYKFQKYDIRIGASTYATIPVEFIHHLDYPIPHNIEIKAARPKTFYYINGIGFNLYTIMTFIKNKYPKEYKTINDYISSNRTNIQHKISRVCWNTHDWKKPSGSDGKARSQNSYEGQNGFGHEEWLGEKFRIIDDFHYSFLQPLNLKSDIHVDKIYDIDIVTNDRLGNFYHVGLIKNVVCISKEESENVFEIYKRKNWVNEMYREIKDIGGNYSAFINHKVKAAFNIKYQIKNIVIFDEIIKIDPIDNNITTHRYKLLNKKDEFIYFANPVNNGTDKKPKSTDTIIRQINTTVVYDAAHNKIQNAVVKLLNESRIYKAVISEHNRIDIAAELPNGNWHFYEIKTFGSAKKSIRAALGQILEYSFWPGRQSAEELIIVSDNDTEPDTISYMKNLREKFNLPISYQAFTFPETLGDKI